MVTVNITRTNIYAIAEGVSITISQHNGGTPSAEQLWASPSESRKLDIYYREAVGDLERRLMDWIVQASSQFSLVDDGSDYVLSLTMSRFWPSRLEGLLKNKVQDYLVHAVTAGWLNDFPDLEVKQDYQAMATADLLDIRDIILQRSFDFNGGARADDDEEKPDPEEQTHVTPRNTDDDSKPDPEDVQKVSPRNTDDDQKDVPVADPEAGYRHQDNVVKQTDDVSILLRKPGCRHQDDGLVVKREDWTDWSGTGLAYGMGGPVCRPERPVPPPKPFRKDFPKCNPIVPPSFPPKPEEPPYRTDCVNWDDDPLYDEQAENDFINGHVCGDGRCGKKTSQPLDWQFTGNTETEVES